MKLKTPTIIALSMAFGIVAGAGVTAIAANQPNMHKALDHLEAADMFLARASNNKGPHKGRARAYISMAMEEVRLGIRVGNF